jgi:predicted Ser/Thr protein kinase
MEDDPSSRPSLDTGDTELGRLEPLETGEPGTRQLAHYALLEEVGRGGMGVVYRARDTILDRQVAVKILSNDLSAQDAFRARFVREARIVARISDPNIPHIYFVGRSRRELFFAMEWVEGETLQDVLRRGRQSVRSALDVTRQVASGLARAHSEGIVHRDIKPSNILLASDGVAKVLDFGIAQDLAVRPDAITSKFAGTPHYSSPEQARGQPAGPRSDIYSLGAVLYELLTGAPPFVGDTPQEVLRARLSRPAPEIPDDVPCSPAVRGLVRRMLTNTSEDRFPDCAALIRGIDRVYPGPVVPATLPRRALAALTDGLLMLLPAMLVFTLYVASRGHYPTTWLYDSMLGRVLLGVLVACWPAFFAVATSDRALRTPGRRLQKLRVAPRGERSASRRWLLLRSLVFWAPVGLALSVQPDWPPLPGRTVGSVLSANLPLVLAAVWSVIWLAFIVFQPRRLSPADWVAGLEIAQSAEGRGADTRKNRRRSKRGLAASAVVSGWLLIGAALWPQIGTLGPVRYARLTWIEDLRPGDPGFERLLGRFAAEHLDQEQNLVQSAGLVIQRRPLHPLLWARTEGEEELRIEDRRYGAMIRGRFSEYVPFVNTYYEMANWEADELTPSDDGQHREWEKRRSAEYRGSVEHFLRALMHERLAEEGFDVQNPEVFHGLFRIDDRFLLVADGELRVTVAGPKGSQDSTLELHRGFLFVGDNGSWSGSAGFAGLWRDAPQLPGAFGQRQAEEQDRSWGRATAEIDRVLEAH